MRISGVLGIFSLVCIDKPAVIFSHGMRISGILGVWERIMKLHISRFFFLLRIDHPARRYFMVESWVARE